MILATTRGDVEARGVNGYVADFSGTDRIPSPAGAARAVGLRSAAGIPAFLRAVRILSQTTGVMPLRTVEVDGMAQVPRPDAPQWSLLHDRPIVDQPVAPFHVWSYVVVCMIAAGGGVLQKLKGRGRLIGLEPIPPARYGGRPKIKNGELVVELQNPRKTLTRDEIIYVPGVLLDDPYIGVSLIESCRRAIANPLARQQFEGDYLANDGGITTVLSHDGEKTPQQRREIRRGFMRTHTRPGVPALVWGGWKMEKVELSLVDAQFIEAQNFTVGDIGRMTGVPGRKLGDPNAPETDPQREDLDLLMYGLLPWIIPLEQSLRADDDLFPDKSLQPKFFTDVLLRADMKTRFESYLRARQAGWLMANEIRREEGREDHPDGDTLQATPVGGAPNPPADPGGHPDETGAGQ